MTGLQLTIYGTTTIYGKHFFFLYYIIELVALEAKWYETRIRRERGNEHDKKRGSKNIDCTNRPIM